MNAWLQKQWYSLTFWHLLLIPLSWLFLFLSALRRAAYQSGLFKSSKIPVPVVVVGNISVGGTGKTPLVIWLAHKMVEAGWKPAIISRGYGAKSLQTPVAVTAKSNPALVGDEPVLIAKRTACPVWVGRDRVAVAEALLESNPECNIIISDDGLQHYSLQRDFEIAVIDASRIFGNGWLLPAGPLRERVARLSSVDAIVGNGERVDSPFLGLSDAVFQMQLESLAFHNLLDSTHIAYAQDFTGKQLHAIAGIGNPDRFFKQLKDMHLQFEAHAFPDHHSFTAKDLQSLRADAILMTEKDAVKCADFAQPNWWYLPVKARVDDGLWHKIQSKIATQPDGIRLI